MVAFWFAILYKDYVSLFPWVKIKIDVKSTEMNLSNESSTTTWLLQDKGEDFFDLGCRQAQSKAEDQWWGVDYRLSIFFHLSYVK